MEIISSQDFLEQCKNTERTLLKELGIRNFNNSEKKLIKEVESLTKEDVFYLLCLHGIEFRSGDFVDYSKAKMIIYRGLWINSRTYDALNDWISEYLNV